MSRAAKRGRKASARTERDAAGRRRGAVKRLGLTLALFAGALGSAFQVVMVAHQQRVIHGLLEQTRNHQDLLLAEHSRLLLERGALAAYHQVERVAEAELNMRFPENVKNMEPVLP